MEFEQIVLKAQKGDLRAASRLAKEFAPMIEKICRFYIKEPDDWQDLSQVILSLFFVKLPGLSYRSRAEIFTYLKSLALRQTLHYLGKEKVYKKRLARYISEQPDDHAEIESLLHCKDLELLVEKLPDRMRLIFNCIAIENYSYGQLELQLGIPEVTLRSYMFRARKILTKLIIENNIRYGR